jgi:anion-transporting  ArsA/GET3 family ATPase
MTTETAGTEPERVIRWMEETPKVFDGVRRILDACDRATEATRRAQAERDRVLQECQALREQVRDLQTDLARLQKERTEAARWFAAMVREAAERFPPAPPPA